MVSSTNVPANNVVVLILVTQLWRTQNSSPAVLLARAVMSLSKFKGRGSRTPPLAARNAKESGACLLNHHDFVVYLTNHLEGFLQGS